MPNYGYMPQNPAFQRPAYQPIYVPQMMQESMVQARFVSGREEAMAATVYPGSMVAFIDRANGRVYTKQIDPNNGMSEFHEYSEGVPQPQFVTAEAFAQYQADMDKRINDLQEVFR